ncbi:MAG: Crp/Fnr family transcriptional regulator [Aminipila sp.]
MKRYLSLLKQNPLFIGINENEIEPMMNCLLASFKSFKKNEIVYMEGDRADKVGIVAEGGIYIINDDILGNRNIIAEAKKGSLFGEAFACANMERFPVSVVAAMDCSVIFIDYKKVVTTCSHSCTFHQKLLENMLRIIAEKNILLNNKIMHLSKRTTREKVMSYLLFRAGQTGKEHFKIPFNRQEFADYLCVDRSALSAELSRMQNEGIINFNKNEFKLIKL